MRLIKIEFVSALATPGHSLHTLLAEVCYWLFVDTPATLLCSAAISIAGYCCLFCDDCVSFLSQREILIPRANIPRVYLLGTNYNFHCGSQSQDFKNIGTLSPHDIKLILNSSCSFKYFPTEREPALVRLCFLF